MLKLLIKDLLFIGLFAVLSASAFLTVKAQENPVQNTEKVQIPDKKPQKLLGLLNLSPEQIKQIRLIQRETRLEMQEAQRAQREAQRALNQAIYADVADKNLVEQRIKELTDAQRRTVETRSRTEFRVRQVLNDEQLARFKELRERFEQRMKQRPNGQNAPTNLNTPNRPLINRNKENVPMQSRPFLPKRQQN